MLLTLFFLILVIYLSWRKPLYGLAVVANAFLFNAIIGNTSGVAFALVGLGGPILCFTSIFLNRIHKKNPIKAKFGFDSVLVFMFFIVAFSSVFYAYDISKALEISIRYLVFCASFYFIFQYVLFFEEEKEKLIKEFVFATLTVGLIIGSYALFKGDSASDYVMRLTIGEVSPIPLSILLGQATLISFYLLVTSKSYKLFYLPVLGLLIYILLLTNTRSTIIGLIMGMSFILLLGKSQISPKLYLKLLISFSILIPISLYFLNSDVSQFERAFSGFNRLSSGELGESEGDRLLAWSYALDAFSKHTFFGVGTGNFGQHYISYPHNMFLEVLSENGLFGFVVIFMLMLIGLKSLFYNNKGVYLLIGSLFVFSFFVAQVSLTMWMHKGLFIWLAILLCSATSNRTRKIKTRFK